jgi:PAS domain S-box-containing protein
MVTQDARGGNRPDAGATGATPPPSRVHPPEKAGTSGSEERWQELVETSAAWIWETDASLRHVYTNAFVTKCLGYQPEEFLRAKTLELIHPDDRPLIEELVEKAVTRGERWYGRVLRWRHKDGSWRYIESSGCAVFDTSGTCTGLRGLDRDVTENLKVEEALRRSNEHLQLVFDSSSDLLILYEVGEDGTARVSSLNKAALEGARRCGYAADAGSLSGADRLTCMRLFCGSDVDALRTMEQLFAAALAQGEAVSHELRIATAHGEIYLDGTFTPVRDAQGRVRHVLWSARNITLRKAVEASLLESREQLSALNSNLADGMVYQINSGTDGRLRSFSYVSPAIERFHGLTVETLRQNPRLLYAQVVEEDRGLVAETEEHAFAARRKFEVDVRVRLPSGEVRWRRFTSAPRTAADGCLLWDGIEQDITERKQAEERLRESEQRFRDIVESMGDWLVELDSSWRVTYSSPQVEQLLGYTPEEMLGTSPMETVAPEERARLAAVMAEFLEGKRRIRDFEVWHLRKDGQPVCLSVSGVPLFDAGGAVCGMRSITQDVTQRKRAEAERRAIETKMHQAQKLESLGILAGGIAHDFNNLLAAVLGNAELALAELPPAASARESVEQIQKAALHAAELTRQMLAYAGRGSLAVQPVSVQEVVRDISQLLGSSISKRHALVLGLAEALPAVEADPAQLRQIVMNLVINASEAIGERDGVISLRTAVLGPGEDVAGDVAIGDLPEARHVLLEVTDTGAGMDAATLARIFDPFFSTKYAGRGLGLAAVLGIMRRHGGALRVRSRPGAGSVFSALLPARENAGPAPVSGTGAEHFPAWRGAGTLLLVDDEETVRSMASRMLRAMGFEVVLAGDGMEALARLEAEGGRIRAVLLDLTMPRMDGEATLRRIREISPDLPVVLCSGYDVSEGQGRFADLTFSGFLQKPFRLAELQRALRRALGE